jgi:hypothetical protein
MLVGNRESLQNEAGVHRYISPVHLSVLFDTISGLFEGCIRNHPEMMLDGTVRRRGRREFGYIFVEGSMLLLIELKFDLRKLNDI